MIIKEIRTHDVSEEYVRNFFDSDWWDNCEEVTDDDFGEFEGGLDELNCDTEFVYESSCKEKIRKIWQEEINKVNNLEHKEEAIKEELENCECEMEYLKEKIRHLKERTEYLKNKLGE